MSRHKYTEGDYTIFVGWDAALDTFFFQAWGDIVQDEVPVFSAGDRRAEIPTIDLLDVELVVKGLEMLPRSLRVRLVEDMQREGRQFDNKAVPIKELLLRLEEKMRYSSDD